MFTQKFYEAIEGFQFHFSRGIVCGEDNSQGEVCGELFVVKIVGSAVEWLERRARDQQGLGSKPTRTILLCPWERHFTALSPAWWSWQAVPN